MAWRKSFVLAMIPSVAAIVSYIMLAPSFADVAEEMSLLSSSSVSDVTEAAETSPAPQICPSSPINASGSCPMPENLEWVVRPWQCAAFWISDGIRGCHLFDMIDFDMDKHHPKSKGPPNAGRLSKYGVIMGLYKGKVYLMRRESPSNMEVELTKGYTDTHDRIKDLLLHAAQAGLPDVEFEFTVDDEGVEGRRWDLPDPDRCQGTGMPFGIVTSPHYCNAVMPPGIYPGPPDLESHTKIPWCEKKPKFYWRGSAWVTQRCPRVFSGSRTWRDNGRTVMVQASLDHPDLVNASFSQGDQGKAWGPPYSDYYQVGPHTSFSENYKYAFVVTAAAPCSYITSVAQHLSSTSVVAKCAEQFDYGAQALYAGLRHGVHLLHIYGPGAWQTKMHWVDQMKDMQKAWRYLEGMQENARIYNKWAHSQPVVLCYFLKLMAGYLSKLNYEMPQGTLAEASSLFDAGKDLEALLGGRAKRVEFAGWEWHMELVDVPKLSEDRATLFTRSLESCLTVEASQPKPKIFNTTTCRWT